MDRSRFVGRVTESWPHFSRTYCALVRGAFAINRLIMCALIHPLHVRQPEPNTFWCLWGKNLGFYPRRTWMSLPPPGDVLKATTYPSYAMDVFRLRAKASGARLLRRLYPRIWALQTRPTSLQHYTILQITTNLYPTPASPLNQAKYIIKLNKLIIDPLHCNLKYIYQQDTHFPELVKYDRSIANYMALTTFGCVEPHPRPLMQQPSKKTRRQPQHESLQHPALLTHITQNLNLNHHTQQVDFNYHPGTRDPITDNIHTLMYRLFGSNREHLHTSTNQPALYLDDNIMNQVMMAINRASSDFISLQSSILQPRLPTKKELIRKLKRMTYETQKLRGVTELKEAKDFLTQLNTILIPVHLSNPLHWVLLEYKLNIARDTESDELVSKPSVTIYDSARLDQYRTLYIDLTNRLSEALDTFISTAKPNPPTADGCPPQTNDVDCGIHVTLNALRIVLGGHSHPPQTEHTIRNTRITIALQIACSPHKNTLVLLKPLSELLPPPLLAILHVTSTDTRTKQNPDKTMPQIPNDTLKRHAPHPDQQHTHKRTPTGRTPLSAHPPLNSSTLYHLYQPSTRLTQLSALHCLNALLGRPAYDAHSFQRLVYTAMSSSRLINTRKRQFNADPQSGFYTPESFINTLRHKGFHLHKPVYMTPRTCATDNKHSPLFLTQLNAANKYNSNLAVAIAHDNHFTALHRTSNGSTTQWLHSDSDQEQATYLHDNSLVKNFRHGFIDTMKVTIIFISVTPLPTITPTLLYIRKHTPKHVTDCFQPDIKNYFTPLLDSHTPPPTSTRRQPDHITSSFVGHRLRKLVELKGKHRLTRLCAQIQTTDGTWYSIDHLLMKSEQNLHSTLFNDLTQYINNNQQALLTHYPLFSIILQPFENEMMPTCEAIVAMIHLEHAKQAKETSSGFVTTTRMTG